MKKPTKNFDSTRGLEEENQSDLAAFEERAEEPTISYEELIKDLKANNKL